ncbi:MAG: glucose 1-dehydrogenase [Gammaproteobacteria bacterium]|nr:glucose 1-dehydrogenase [Gammaproteobacteria bacterium]
MGRLDGRVAMVTGAAGGIGACAARQLAAEGATVVLTDVDTEGGRQVAAEPCGGAGRMEFVRLDVTREDDWLAVIAQVEREHGGLDVLVNNAGITLIKPIAQTSLAEWRRLTAVNVDSVCLGMKHALPAMTARARSRIEGGSIINMSSVAGIVGVPNCLAYSMTKAAVRHMTKSAALEFADAGYNIRVNSIHPGFTRTPMAESIYRIWAETGAFGTRDLEATRRIFVDLHPLRRQEQPLDVARGVVFLACDESGYMTGAELVIDGGFVTR